MIVPMARVRIFGPQELLDEATCLLYQMGILHPDPLPDALRSRVRVRDRRTEDRDAVRERERLEGLLEKVRRSLVLLPRPASPGESPAAPVTAAGLRSERTARTVEEVYARIEALTAQRREAADRLALLSRYRQMVRAVLPLLERVGDTTRLEMVGLTVAREHQDVIPLLEQELERTTSGLVQVVSTDVDERTLAALVLYGRSDAPRVRALLWERNLSELRLPSDIERLPLRDALREIAGQAERLPDELRRLDAALALLAARWHAWLAALGIALADRAAQIGARASFFRTRYSFVVSGWVPRATLPELRRGIEEVSAGRIVLEEVPLTAEEQRRAPVQLANPRLVRPFEVFVRLLPLPVYGTVDPTPLLALTFPLFFGLIVGDVGYGLAIAAIALLLRRRIPRASRLRELATVLLLSSASAVAFGVAFGEFLGTLGESFGMRPLHPGLHRLRSLPFFLGLSVGIGCVHVFLGIALGALNALRAGHRAGLMHRAGQAASLGALILIVAALAGAVSRGLLGPGVVLLLAGLAIWVAGEGFAAPLELLSTAGNVLSYARLMAVGLAGVVLAMVANEMGSRSRWGVVAAILLHAVNLVLVIFSPTIHAMRLHLVEFFTKFYVTGGSEYKPLKSQGEA